jgi:hypothetical protein
VVEVDGELVWLAPHSGQELQRVRLAGDASAPPLVTNAGIAVVPMVSGELVVVEPLGARQARIFVARAPVWPPVWSEPSARITGAAGAVVVGVDLSAWSRSFARREPPGDDAPADPEADSEHDPSSGAGEGPPGSPRVGSAVPHQGTSG